MALSKIDIPVSPEDVLDQLSIQEIIDYYGDDLLDGFGEDAAIQHFNIEVKE